MDHLAEEVVGQLGVLAGLKDDALQALLDHTVSSLLSSSPLTEGMSPFSFNNSERK